MLKPHDFDTVQANSTFTPLAPGGYICRIMGVEESSAQSSGAPSLHVSLDIADGPEANRFATEYRNDTRNPKKWGCVYRQVITTKDGGTNPFFKGMICAIEESNGMTVQWTDNKEAFAAQFKGKLIGVLFGREEYTKQDGTNTWITRPQSCLNIGDIRNGNFKVPEDKPLAQSAGAYTTPGYTAPQFDQSAIDRYLGGNAPSEPPVSVPPAANWNNGANDLPFTFNS